MSNALSNKAVNEEAENGLFSPHCSVPETYLLDFIFSPGKILHSVNLCKLKEMKQIKEQNKALNIVWQYLR